MKITHALIGLVLSASSAVNVAAQSLVDRPDRAQPAVLIAQSSDVMTNGEIRKVDKDAKKITIKHEEIKNLGMPPMTMVFQVKDPAMLGQVKQGDKVRFHVEQVGGATVVTQIEVAK